MTTRLEPADKLGAAVTSVAVVNGPQDEPLEWDAVDWRACERQVQRLRQRIFTASQVGDLKQVRNLQKLMLRSRANTLLARVLPVAARHPGRLAQRAAGAGRGLNVLGNGIHRCHGPAGQRVGHRLQRPGRGGRRQPATTSGTIVWHSSGAAVTDASVRAQMTALLDRVEDVPGVQQVVSPYDTAGAGQLNASANTA
jgi:hypothetical protein